MSISISIEAVQSADTVEQLWSSLDEKGSQSFFLSWHWIGSWLRSLPTLKNVYLLKVIDDGKICGASCISVHRRRLAGVIPVRTACLNATGDQFFDKITIEHNWLLSPDICSANALREVVSSLLQSRFGMNQVLLPGLSSTLRGSSDFLLRSFPVVGFYSDLSLFGNGQLPSWLSRNSRQKLGRLLKGCQSNGLYLDVADTPLQKLTFFREMRELHIQSWARRGKKPALENAFLVEFLERVIRCQSKTTSVDMLRITCGDAILGYLMNFTRGGTIYNYQSGFDVQHLDKRPGYTAHLLALRYYAQKRMQRYDFLAGENQLKKSLSTNTYHIYYESALRRTLLFQAIRSGTNLRDWFAARTTSRRKLGATPRIPEPNNDRIIDL